MGRKRKLENRDRILEGATSLLREGPYRGLTVDALARRIQMSKSTLYKYYRDKDHLVDAVVVDSAGALEAALDLEDPDAPLEGLRRVLTAWQEFGEQCPAPILLERDRLPPAASRRIDRLFDRVAQVIGARVQSAASRGQLRIGADLATLTLVAASHAGVVARARGESVDLVPLVDVVSS